MRDHTKPRAFKLADEIAVLSYMITNEGQVEYLKFPESAFGPLKELHHQFSLVSQQPKTKCQKTSAFSLNYLNIQYSIFN